MVEKNMVDKLIKFICKSGMPKKLLKFMEDLVFWDVLKLQCKTHEMIKNTFRCRIWNVRIVSTKIWNKLEILKIGNRRDIY